MPLVVAAAVGPNRKQPPPLLPTHPNTGRASPLAAGLLWFRGGAAAVAPLPSGRRPLVVFVAWRLWWLRVWDDVGGGMGWWWRWRCGCRLRGVTAKEEDGPADSPDNGSGNNPVAFMTVAK